MDELNCPENERSCWAGCNTCSEGIYANNGIIICPVLYNALLKEHDAIVEEEFQNGILDINPGLDKDGKEIEI